jgi:hypothetical protein
MALAGMEQAPFVRTAGESGQLWDVWQSAAYVDALDGWLGLVYKSADGFHGQDPDRHHFGPFRTQQEAVNALRADASGAH